MVFHPPAAWVNVPVARYARVLLLGGLGVKHSVGGDTRFLPLILLLRWWIALWVLWCRPTLYRRFKPWWQIVVVCYIAWCVVVADGLLTTLKLCAWTLMSLGKPSHWLLVRLVILDDLVIKPIGYLIYHLQTIINCVFSIAWWLWFLSCRRKVILAVVKQVLGFVELFSIQGCKVVWSELIISLCLFPLLYVLELVNLCYQVFHDENYFEFQNKNLTTSHHQSEF